MHVFSVHVRLIFKNINSLCILHGTNIIISKMKSCTAMEREGGGWGVEVSHPCVFKSLKEDVPEGKGFLGGGGECSTQALMETLSELKVKR